MAFSIVVGGGFFFFVLCQGGEIHRVKQFVLSDVIVVHSCQHQTVGGFHPILQTCVVSGWHVVWVGGGQQGE